MRLLAVTDAMPQKNWATIEMKTRNFASPIPTAMCNQARRGVHKERVIGRVLVGVACGAKRDVVEPVFGDGKPSLQG